MAELTFDRQPLRERITIFTPLGIRFWDPVRDSQVRDHLVVTARPETMYESVTTAFQTASGVYAFQDLPGLHAVEYPEDGPPLQGSPPRTQRFVIAVKDRLERFLPAAFCLDLPLPYRGIFLNAALSSPVQESPPFASPLFASPPISNPPGVYLFSAPTRTVSPGIAAIRGHLVEYTPGSPPEQPAQDAAYAVLEVQVNGSNQTWYGIANSRGCIAVLFPYPPIRSRLQLSPPGLPQISLQNQRWDIAIRVRYSPDTLQPLPGTKVPDLRSLFRQSAGRIWLSQTGPSVSEWSTELYFGEELVVRTGNSATLMLSPGA
jgi:hypothetical protein